MSLSLNSVQCDSGIFCGQVVIFVDADNAVRKEKGLHPNRFADLYHSANRTPVSTSEDWYRARSMYSWFTYSTVTNELSIGSDRTIYLYIIYIIYIYIDLNN